jgi:hypothetical protein
MMSVGTGIKRAFTIGMIVTMSSCGLVAVFFSTSKAALAYASTTSGSFASAGVSE